MAPRPAIRLGKGEGWGESCDVRGWTEPRYTSNCLRESVFGEAPLPGPRFSIADWLREPPRGRVRGNDPERTVTARRREVARTSAAYRQRLECGINSFNHRSLLKYISMCDGAAKINRAGKNYA